mmetsp:Transcript_53059/g.151285  ORF Transcript_53059/g.151285 Transcript_53059/m.151285 type:complete len:213 (-) Transcript_53059:150-788(-)
MPHAVAHHDYDFGPLSELGCQMVQQKEMAEMVRGHELVVTAFGLKIRCRPLPQLPPLLLGEVGDPVRPGGVEEHQVQGRCWEARLDVDDESPHLVEVAQVGVHRRGEAVATDAKSAHDAGRVRRSLLVRAVHQHVGPEHAELLGGLQADAGGAACHQRALLPQIDRHGEVPAGPQGVLVDEAAQQGAARRADREEHEAARAAAAAAACARHG